MPAASYGADARSCWLLWTLVLAACSFSSDSHPAACETDADCSEGQLCYQTFCVAESGKSVLPPGADTGSGGAPSRSGGSSASAGSGGGPGAGNGGSMSGNGGSGLGGSPSSSAGGGPALDGGGVVDPPLLDAGPGASDAGMVPTVEPYAACTGDQDCNPDDVCRLGLGGAGVCAASCGSAVDCARPSGTYTASVLCDVGHCRLDCSPSPPVPPFPRTCPPAMTCVLESGAQSCYP